jgi:uncharacterized LabA/DUF88 family protein
MKTFVFIDASNLFYGGEKSLGWKIDYEKLFQYFKDKYQADKVFYFGGIEIFGFKHDYLKSETVEIELLEKYLSDLLKGQSGSSLKLSLIRDNHNKTRFYLKLKKFGYNLFIKPVKMYKNTNGNGFVKKANCDVDMAFYLMKEKDDFDQAIILSGDGDFLPVLKYLREIKKQVIILSRGDRTAREIRQFAGSNFRDFVRLESHIKFEA